MTGTEDNSEGASQHSEELERSASQQGFTDDDAKEAFAQELIAFNTSVEPKLETLIDLFSQGRLLDLRDALTRDRAMVLRLRAALDHARELLEQRRDELPVTNPANRAVLTKRFNQCIATHRLMDRRQDAQAHAAELTKLLKTCDESIETLETRMIYDDIAAGTPPTGTAPAAADGVNGATATSTPPADATAAEHPHKTPELTRTEAHNPSTKDKATPDHPADDAGKDFGDSTSPHASRTALHGGSGGTPLPPSSDRARHPSPRRARGTPLPSCHGSDGPIFGPLRSDIAASSSSSTRATSTPLAYTATGKSLLPTTDSGPDFSLYGQNPFYLNSALKLPLPVEVAYDPATKAPIQSQVQLKPLDPPSFNGNFVYWPRFRDDFIRLVHTPGRYLTDAERLRYLKLALKGTALAIASRYNTSHSSDGAYHQVTAALELEFYRPFQARKVLHHDFLELKPPSNNPDALRAFAEDTISAVNLLREYDSDMNRDCIAIERWMEKIPNQTRLEMCRELDVTTDLTLEDAVRALRKVIYWQTTNAIFSPSCGLGRSAAKSSGTPLAITAGPSGPIITEVKDDESAGGFFGTPKATQDRRAPRCCFCGTIGDHWASRCTVYETTSQRLERAKQLRFCLMCLRKGHAAGAKSCRATFDACRYCHGTHHRALCPEYRNRESPKKKTNNKTKKYRQPRLHHERNSYEGKPQSSQPVRAGAAPPQQKEPRTSRPAALASGSGPVGAGRRADGKGTPAARYAPQRQSLATHAATTSLEESTDGPMKKGTKTTADPAGSSGHRDAEPLKAATPNRSKAQPSGDNSEDTSGDNSEDAGSTGHISDAPTEPETDTEEEYDDDEDAQLDGVGTFGATVPSGAELCRTHLLECVIAEVFNPDNPSRMKTATVFFDCGSSKTFVSDELAADLGLINLGRQELTLDTFANDHSVKLDTFQTKIGLTTTKRQRVILDAAASPKVVRQLRTALISEADVPALRRNKCILIPDYVSPDMVIGRDTQHHFRKRDILSVLPSGFCLVRSTLGTMVAGLGSVRKTANGTPLAPLATPLKTSNAPLGNSQEHDTVSFGSFFATADGDEASHLEQMAENFWKTENIGIEPNSQTPDDLLAHEGYKQTTTIDDEGRYQCRLPWKTPDGLSPSNVVLPTYEGMARRRLSSLQRTHQHDPEFLLKYGEAFTTMEEQNVIE
ncbi:Zinc knuckle family protein, partial [Aphelenchoides avenae]